MKKEKLVYIQRIYGILLSISILLAGICLMAGCLTIYYTGEKNPYSREIVAETFSRIAVPVYICIALSIGGFVLELLHPASRKKTKSEKAYASILNRLLTKKDLNDCDESLLLSINKERNRRRLHIIVRSVLLLIGSILFLAYAANEKNWPDAVKITTAMIQAMWMLIPCMVVPFAYAIFTAYYNTKSFQREIELVKQLPSTVSQNETDGVNSDRSVEKWYILRYVLLGVSIFILIYGYISGGTVDVLTKAINICTECIGLG